MADRIGWRIAVQRRRRGLSQVALAGLVGRSESWLSQVERGQRRVDSYSALRDLARVLLVDIGVLAEGGPGSGAPRPDPSDRRIAAVEWALLGGGGTYAADVADVVRRAHEDYQAARYDTVLDGLAGLVEVLGPGVPDAILTSGYTVTAKMLTKIGAPDLALLAADRAWTAAQRSADPADLGMAVYQVTCALLSTSRAGLGEDLAVRTAVDAGGTDPAATSTTGALWLIAAVAAARRPDGVAAVERLDRAQMLAEALGADANHRWTAFGPTNVAIHRVSVAVELGDAAGALAAASAVDPDRLPAALSSCAAPLSSTATSQRRLRRETMSGVRAASGAPQTTRVSGGRVTGP